MKQSQIFRCLCTILIVLLICTSCSVNEEQPIITPVETGTVMTILQTQVSTKSVLALTPKSRVSPTQTSQAPINTEEPETAGIDFFTIKDLPWGYYAKLSEGSNTYVMSLDGKITQIAEGIVMDDLTYNGQIIQVRDNGILNIYDLLSGKVQTYTIQEQFYAYVSPNQKWLITESRNPAHGTDMILRYLDKSRPEVNLSGLLAIPAEAYKNFAWSPDSRWLSILQYTSRGGSSPDGLYFLDTSCFQSPQSCKSVFYGSYLPIDFNLAFDYRYGWSPDSENVVIASRGENSRIAMFSMITKQFELVDLGETLVGPSVKWSPDGRQIFVESSIESALDSPTFFLFDIETHKVSKLYKGDYILIGVLSTYPPPQFKIGNTLTISGAGKNLKVRSLPSYDGRSITKLDSGDQVLLEEGPIKTDNDIWWKVMVVGKAIEGYCLQNQDWYHE